MGIEVVVLGCESGFSSKSDIPYQVRLYYLGKNGQTEIAAAEEKNAAVINASKFWRLPYAEIIRLNPSKFSGITEEEVSKEEKNQAGAVILACRKMLEAIGVHLNGAVLLSHYLNIQRKSEVPSFRYDLQWSFCEGNRRQVKMSVGEDKDLPIAVLKATVDFFARFQGLDIRLDFIRD